MIVVATNEKSIEYKNKLIELLPNNKLIFENEYFKYLPNDIKNDNYCIYLISNEIAKNANINIITHNLRLGDKYDYCLSDFQ